jgi:hypothetical protein
VRICVQLPLVAPGVGKALARPCDTNRAAQSPTVGQIWPDHHPESEALNIQCLAGAFSAPSSLAQIRV